MEFDELQKIWDSQNQRPMYMINEDALHNRIHTKKAKASHITNASEWLLMVVNAGAGCVLFGLTASKAGSTIFMYLLAGWMLITALAVLVSRIRRLQRENRFDRSLVGELDHAIAMTTYQVRLSQLMRWNNLPIALLIIAGLLEGGKPLWFAFALVIFFILVNFASGWEHRFYQSRKLELETLQRKLQQG
ncbi:MULTISPECIES: hypothetical protein [unclassified Spirosoma]|uniref:hypothetical protein n=1 Tax=unclassified Spirosoma TaxID=2621999 RepID=UPI0009637BFF|nr:MULTISPECIES: hypothetical protein [unclassified Spirosoma]MBN8822295.1 hypothetical protein [Spirosoma sp.]OJW72400.1 MAG: hypothetical protein BGO59_14785 [Spirosoma sp. 48-14]